MKVRHLLRQAPPKRRLPRALPRRLEGINNRLMLTPLLVRRENRLSKERRGHLTQLKRDRHRVQRRVQLPPWVRRVLVEEDVAALRVVHARETLHEVAEFFPLVVVAFEEVCAVLDGDDDGAAVGELGLGGESEEDAGGEGDYGGDGGLGRGLVFVVAEGAGVEDAVGALVVGDGLVAEVHCGFGGAGCEFFGVFVDVVEVVLGLES